MRKIDVFTHISPPGYSEGVERLAGNLKDIGKRSRGVPMLHDLDIRFRVMDMFPEYQQVLSLPTPPIELFAQPARRHRARAHRQRLHGRARAQASRIASSDSRPRCR